MSTFSQLTRSYRQNKRAVAKVQQQIQALQEKMKELRTHENDLKKDLRLTKSLIDYCVETGESPVEAQLKRTPYEIVDYVQQTDLERTYGHDLFSSTQPGFITSSSMINTGINTSGLGTISLNPFTGSTTVSSSNISISAQKVATNSSP
jgi:hypothetical protein